MKKSICQDERGMALVTIMMTLLVLSLLGTAVIGMAASNVKNGIVEREFQASYYIAEGGAVYFTEDMKNGIWDIYNDSAVTNATTFFQEIDNKYLNPQILSTSQFEIEYGSQPEAKVYLKKLDTSVGDTRSYALISEGKVDGVTRTVQKNLLLKWTKDGTPTGLLTVFSSEDMTLKNGEIDGPIGTNEDIIVTGDPTIDDYHLYDDEAEIDDRTGYWMNKPNKRKDKKPLGEKREYAMPDFPIYPGEEECTQIFGSDGSEVVKGTGWNQPFYINLTNPKTYIKSLEAYSGDKAIIQVGDSDKILMLDRLNIPQGHIVLEGTGNLTIYIRENINLNGGTTVNYSDTETDVERRIEASKRLAIYLDESVHNGTVIFLGNVKLNGSIYVRKANLELTASGGIVGNIVTGGDHVKVDGTGNSVSQMIYAPNARVEVTGSGNLKGPIVSKEFSLDGGGKVSFDPDDKMPDNPFFPPTIDSLVPVIGALREQ